MMLESKMAHLLSVSVFGIRFVFAGAHQNSHISPIKSEKECFVETPASVSSKQRYPK